MERSGPLGYDLYWIGWDGSNSTYWLRAGFSSLKIHFVELQVNRNKILLIGMESEDSKICSS